MLITSIATFLQAGEPLLTNKRYEKARIIVSIFHISHQPEKCYSIERGKKIESTQGKQVNTKLERMEEDKCMM